jgi:hypothetical protein
MTDEDFLSRWSRRKRMANVPVSSEAPASRLEEAKDENIPSPLTGAADAVEEFDLSTLPPLESISATTDVTAFLRKGVPPALSREALRRAWIADPTIRDFVGLAENAWDFNDPDAMPGFGPLDYSPEELRDLVSRIVGGARRAADDIEDPAAPHEATDQTLSAQADQDQSPGEADMPGAGVGQAVREVEHPEVEHREPEHVAAQGAESAPRERQDGAQGRADVFPAVRRTHGGALPR